MGARGSKSKKGSDASLDSKQPHDLVFFIDKCLGLHVVPDALRAHGETVELKTDHFEPDTADHEWLPAVGSRGWIILSKDKSLRHNHIELIALLKSNTHCFILTSGSDSGPDMANAFITAMPQIKALVAKFRPPFVATVTKTGNVRVYHTHEGLIEATAIKRSEKK